MDNSTSFAEEFTCMMIYEKYLNDRSKRGEITCYIETMR